jgi:hypothetical protein
LSTRLSQSKFTASISQPKGSACSVTLRVARSESNLSAQGSSLFSSSISSIESLKLVASNMPKVIVKRAGLKALIWFDVTSTCTEGTAVSEARSINVAITKEKAKGKKSLSSTRAWVQQLRTSLKRS